GQDVPGLRDLPRRSRVDDLHDRGAGLRGLLEQLGDALAVLGRHLRPRLGQPFGVLLDVGAALVGEAVGPPPGGLLARDQALVGELLERRVDRAGARLPGAAAALVDLLDDLVAVARLLGEQDEDRRADVALARLGAAPPRAAAPARPRRARAGAEAGRPPRSGAGSAAEQPAEVRDVAASPVTAVHMP